MKIRIAPMRSGTLVKCAAADGLASDDPEEDLHHVHPGHAPPVEKQRSGGDPWRNHSFVGCGHRRSVTGMARSPGEEAGAARVGRA